MLTKTGNTWWARIYISGPIAVAEQVCREECLREGLCVTVEPTHFIYTGGEEAGVVVGLINYPRFPADAQGITDRANDLAAKLLARMCQYSTLVMTPDETTWITKREDSPC